jgi:predicted ArsR family transcriptional regulator
LVHIRHDTQEVCRTRDELAADVGISPDEVSRVMHELMSIGAVSQKRVRVPGMRGPGRAAYFLNPVIGTRQPAAARERAQAEAPALRLVTPSA